jgi:hypothetical protein
MASKTVKFEVELRGLRVKFEGDIQIAEKFSGEIAGAINNLASAQQKLLPAPQRQAAHQPAQIEGGRRGGRRRKRTAAGGGIDPAIIDGATVDPNGDGDADAGEVRRRRSGAGQSGLVTALKDDGFFSSKRTISDIRGALGKKGHSFKSNEISPTLVALTQQEILQREKNDKDQWVYFA